MRFAPRLQVQDVRQVAYLIVRNLFADAKATRILFAGSYVPAVFALGITQALSDSRSGGVFLLCMVFAASAYSTLKRRRWYVKL